MPASLILIHMMDMIDMIDMIDVIDTIGIIDVIDKIDMIAIPYPRLEQWRRNHNREKKTIAINYWSSTQWSKNIPN